MKLLNALFSLQILCIVCAQNSSSKNKEKLAYDNYSFDFSAKRRPIAYQQMGNAVELQSKIKLNPAVPSAGGAYALMTKIVQKEVEFDIEFTIQSDLYKSRGFSALFTQNELYTEDFEHDLGYRLDYEGIGVYVFRNPIGENKWFVMTL